MEGITVNDIVKATGGRLLCGDGNTPVRHFSIDSRTGSPDSIFVPIIGERVDAHRFIEDAMKINGACFTSEHDSAEDSKPWIRVEDTVRAMQQLGTYYRNRMDMPVVAVTGSVGKTTTRQMIATVLGSCKRIYQTKGNQNSQIGVPLTLAEMSADDEAAVLEIGMSERGQIRSLTTMIRPDYAVVTNIGVSHIAQLGSRENICLEKMDIVEGLTDRGTVVLNGDDPYLKAYRGKLPYKTFFYGLGEDCDFRAADIRTKGIMTEFTLIYKENGEEIRLPVTLGMLGKHNVLNSLAGLCIARQMGLPMDKAAASLKDFTGIRLKIHRLKSCTLIDDSYNASPDSLKASVSVLADFEGAGGRKIAGISDMLELGENEKQYHFDTGVYIGQQAIDEVAAFGNLSKETLAGIRSVNPDMKVTELADREAFDDYLMATIRPDDVLLLKASNGMGLMHTARKLIDMDAEAEQKTGEKHAADL